MFNEGGNKQKLKYLTIGVVPVLLLCYELAVKKTFQEYSTYQQAMAAMVSNGAPGSNEALDERASRIDKFYNRYLLDTFATEKNLLSIVSNYCQDNNLTLKEYRTLSLVRTDSVRLLTRVLTVEGKYIPSMKLIYELETKRNAGRVSSTTFNSYFDNQHKELKLDCTIYIQNLIP